MRGNGMQISATPPFLPHPLQHSDLTLNHYVVSVGLQEERDRQTRTK